MFSLAGNSTPFLFLVLALGAPAVAQPPPEAEARAEAPTRTTDKKALNAVLSQFKVLKDANGKEQLTEANSVRPGDVIEYRVVYTNNGDRPIVGLTADLPIPDGLEYLPRSAKPGADRVRAATRNGVFAAEPLLRTVNGRAEPVPYDEYRQLRWTLGRLPANGVTAVSARARVETAPTPDLSPAASTSPAAAAASGLR